MKIIMIHQYLGNEAHKISESFKDLFNPEIEFREQSLEVFFEGKSCLGGYLVDGFVIDGIRKEFINPDDIIFIIISNDIYLKACLQDNWVFGGSLCKVAIISTARIKGDTSEPSANLSVPENIYYDRLVHLAVHELGHCILEKPPDYYLESYWVNAKNESECLPLREHCIDNQCVMYQMIDLKAPPPDKEYLKLGECKKYDAGLDDSIARKYPKFFCQRCWQEIESRGKA